MNDLDKVAIEQKLEDVRAWAQEKIASGAEPPWAWFQYMKLIETADAILGSREATTKESSQQSAMPVGEHLRLVGPNDQQDGFQRHPAGLPTQLPM